MIVRFKRRTEIFSEKFTDLHTKKSISLISFSFSGSTAGNLYAGATAGNGVGAAAGLGGETSGRGAVGTSYAGASSGASGAYVEKTAVKPAAGAFGASGSFSASYSGAKAAEGPVETAPRKEYVERTIIPNYVEKTIQVPTYVEKTVKVPTVVEQRIRVPAEPTVVEKTVSAPPGALQETNVQKIVPVSKSSVKIHSR